jgi:hypothetical protein
MRKGGGRGREARGFGSTEGLRQKVAVGGIILRVRLAVGRGMGMEEGGGETVTGGPEEGVACREERGGRVMAPNRLLGAMGQPLALQLPARRLISGS